MRLSMTALVCAMLPAEAAAFAARPGNRRLVPPDLICRKE